LIKIKNKLGKTRIFFREFEKKKSKKEKFITHKFLKKNKSSNFRKKYYEVF
jgi:hypothetical protein